MPRAAKSKISEVVAFFRSVSLEVMEIAKEMVDDVVRERRGKSTKARERAQETAQPAAATPAAPRKKAKKAKSAGKKRGPKPRNQPLPLEPGTNADDDYGDAAVNTAPPSGQPATLTAP